MAVFLINICKFDGCGITFPSLSDLIQHIEDTHIDYDPKVVEQKELAQPTSLPLSYVLRFVAADAPKDGPFIPNNATGADMKRKLAIKHHSYSMSSSNRSNTPTGSEMDEEDMVVSESDDSNDSWTTEEFSSEFIMRYGSRHSGTGTIGSPGNEKPFACPVPGCKKRYKNVNGIKYHSKNGHKKDGKVKKGYKCTCGKSYKTSQGLKNHAHAAHNTSSESIIVTQHVSNGGTNGTSSGILMQRSTSPSQRSIGSLSPSSISNMSSSASSCHGGSSSMTNGNSCSGNNSNIQHQVTNSISCGASVNGGGGGGQTVSATNNGNNSIQQQQFNTTANSSNQLNIAPAPAHSQPPTPTSASISVQQQQYMPLYLCQNLSGAEQNSNGGNIGGVQKQPQLLQQQQKQQMQLKHQQQQQTAQTIQIAKLQQAKQIVLTQQQLQLQQPLQQQQQTNQATTGTNKITVPSLLNLGILTPAASPTKQSMIAQHTQPQQVQSQNLVAILQQQKMQNNNNNNKATNKSNNLPHLVEHSANPQQQQQQHTFLLQQHHQAQQQIMQNSQQQQQPNNIQKTTTIAVSAQQLAALASLNGNVGRRMASNVAALLRNTPSPVGSTNRHRNCASAAANLESSSIMNISHNNAAAVAEPHGRDIVKNSVAPAHAKYRRLDVRNIGNSVPSIASYRPSLVSPCPSAAAVAPNSVSDGDATTRCSTITPPAAADVASKVGYAHPSPIAQPSYPVAAAMTPAVDNAFQVSMGHTLSRLAKGIDGSIATPTSISPTFIEHKYSANTLKKQFYANMNRNNHNSSNTAKRADDTNHLHGGEERTDDFCKWTRLVNVGCNSGKN